MYSATVQNYNGVNFLVPLRIEDILSRMDRRVTNFIWCIIVYTIMSTPVASTETPVASTETPVASTETPVASTETPVASTETPVASTETPVAGGSSRYSIRRRCPVKTHKTLLYPQNLARFTRSAHKLPKTKQAKQKQGIIMKRLKMCKRTCKNGPRTITGRCPVKRK